MPDGDSRYRSKRTAYNGRNGSRFVKKQKPLNTRQKAEMFIFFMRDSNGFARAKTRLKPESIPPEDGHYALLWEVLTNFHDQHGVLPKQRVLKAEIQALTEYAPVEPEKIAELSLLITKAFSLKKSELQAEAANEYLRRYLIEQLFSSARSQFFSSDLVPVQAASVLANFADAAKQAEQADTGAVSDPFPEDWDADNDAVIVQDTGVPYLNHFLNGGHANGEVMLVLGASGSCKTTLAVQLCVECAKLLHRDWYRGGEKEPLPLVYYICYEDFKSLRYRALSVSTRLERNDLTKPGFIANLSRQRPTASKLSPYELLEKAKSVLNANWRPVDFTGATTDDPDSQKRGGGLVPEIVDVINADLAQVAAKRGCKTRCAMIIVDYALEMVERHVTVHNQSTDTSYLSRLLQKLPMELRRDLALRYDCPVWLLQQLNADAETVPCYRLPLRTQAQWCRGMSNACDFTFIIGNPEKDTQLFLFGAAKQRRICPAPPMVLKLEGQFARIRSVNDEYAVDTGHRGFVKKSDQHMVAAPLSTSRRRRLTIGEDADDGIQPLGT